MQREHLKQRIHYLIHHGGIYPEPECGKVPRHAKALLALLGAVLLLELVGVILQLR